MSVKRKKVYRMIGIIVGVLLIAVIAGVCFLNSPRFGRSPRGERLERIKQSPNYKDGQFHNQHSTVLMSSNRGMVRNMIEFLFRKQEGLRPDKTLPMIKIDLKNLDRNEDVLVWFGHSSYFIQTNGKRILVDPVFCIAAPVSFVNKPFKGTDVYKPEDMPDIDYLVISHDHWDHLDYETVMILKDRIDKVICALGVGEHFEYWGFPKNRIVEMDWNEQTLMEDGFTFYCLPTRHFSGRSFVRNSTLWASYLVETPSLKIYLGGDGGYDTHFAEIGKRFRSIDLAILENGQYNEDWKYIHMMPTQMAQAARDLKAERVMTVHHSKYALSKHRWDEPLENERKMGKDSINMLIPQLGELISLN